MRGMDYRTDDPANPAAARERTFGMIVVEALVVLALAAAVAVAACLSQQG